MTVTAVRKDPDTLTMTIVAEFDASPERVWRLWADPRQHERWWGPPGYPATFTTHDLVPGRRIEYHLTGPAGEQMKAYLDVVEVHAPHRLVFREGFAADAGASSSDRPANELRVTIEAIDDDRTRMSVQTTFPSRQAMEEFLAMGMEEGFTASIAQIDGVLTADRSGTRSRHVGKEPS
jgi:uncharacterized protein YndB with AHSA1/START domain